MSATHGPRMNRVKTREVVDKLKLRVVESDANGILVERLVTSDFDGVGGQHGTQPYHERWRIYTGGGIAGNSDQIWLRRVPVAVHSKPRGPYWNKAQLEKALRAWRRGE